MKRMMVLVLPFLALAGLAIPRCGQPPICTPIGKVVKDHFISVGGGVPYAGIYTSDGPWCSQWTIVDTLTYARYPIGSTYYGPVHEGGSW